jgi:hypothetical protein
MKRRLFSPVGVILFAIVSVTPIGAIAQTVGVGRYYPTPSWDQQLQCDTPATCPRFIVLSKAAPSRQRRDTTSPTLCRTP